jgi:periplasmic divalent cation tolerance protein
MTGCIAVQTTAATRDDAVTIAAALVERRLAACCQIDAIESVYRWNDALTRETEHRLTIKTRADRFDAVAACIAELHHYDLPEIIALLIVTGSAAYLAWAEAETG